MAKMIFVNLPVKDVEASIAFYQAIGATKDERFSQPDKAASMQVSDTIVFMLLSHDFFAGFSPKPIADAHQSTEVLLCLSQDSREAVDAITEAAAKAGGKADIRPPQDHGFMYGRSFEDPDGHIFEPMYMDLDAALAAMGGQTQAA
ncbi:lactoylglutathione lyase [Microvirga sp. SRT01]|uniref:Glyoxalase/bleomycin resistance/extradiol dioxygenase family protein n=1 Tax=Sphingomonas longa TaxID=2778730 RepID=A0ABS2D7Z8_9SPHN|nr:MULTISPECIES: VOC family protein [Alphaproteobacteria]MBM6576164.1 glyoxalase/bleomycin resistance/extradiol dioxygenase family protein [Sphingomonas sp. BT552]MBR7709209.1 lactoylglutathione lyase [Microvirga sp. SRT01]